MTRRILITALDMAGVLLIGTALWLWLPPVAIGFFGLAALFFAWTIEGRAKS